MMHGSLFSGIGGFDLAAEWMGWQNIFHCEWIEFPRKILKYYWPKAISYENICTTDFTAHRGQIDILTGGFPCQPYSSAGKRLGKEDSRHLWPEMLRAIREIKPSWVVGENVRGLTNWNGGVVFEEVCADLENLGYEVQPILLPACAVNAPHRRDRIWFVAHATSSSKRTNELRGLRPEDGKISREGTQTIYDATRPNGTQGIITDSNNTRFKAFDNKKSKLGTENRTKTFSGNGFESVHTRNGWEDFPTQSPICNGDDGLFSRLDSITFLKWRSESIKGGGNAIVPQVAYQIFKVIEQLKQRQ